ncbi:KdsC family phosphatase [Pseudoxanthomonas broegbernensis]|uniref:KdsC family phosphatase n=1 Tax=Pseudoxanthomonas broegbernensis TaxID=83619 RepID=UPI00160F37E4|nr:HAD hydrolase family protein [Pseudoxanthomonas broegbernensis]MBB6065276.1 3-deoxy-D-manno-octulosonate 8-phosphate phosphatase (KDO 8-P phosphatase) [Pseudoxanthomonas broegbernensis]
MPYDPLASVTPDIHKRAGRIGLVCLDVDGTLTDGRLYFDSAGNELKSFSVLDGQGLTQLLRFGFHVALITARPSLVAQKRGADLGLETHIGVLDKLACMDDLIERHGLSRERTCFVGDDLPDLDCLREAGLAVAPANAHPWIAEIVHWRTRARAGEGAVREVCDVLLAAQGHVPAILAGHGSRDGRRA